ncbi:hypothetical protein ACP70R_044048 [Stipagrostis hirtigluma subsp. patula]
MAGIALELNLKSMWKWKCVPIQFSCLVSKEIAEIEIGSNQFQNTFVCNFAESEFTQPWERIEQVAGDLGLHLREVTTMQGFTRSVTRKKQQGTGSSSPAWNRVELTGVRWSRLYHLQRAKSSSPRCETESWSSPAACKFELAPVSDSPETRKTIGVLTGDEEDEGSSVVGGGQRDAAAVDGSGRHQQRSSSPAPGRVKFAGEVGASPGRAAEVDGEVGASPARADEVASEVGLFLPSQMVTCHTNLSSRRWGLLLAANWLG